MSNLYKYTDPKDPENFIILELRYRHMCFLRNSVGYYYYCDCNQEQTVFELEVISRSKGKDLLAYKEKLSKNQMHIDNWQKILTAENGFTKLVPFERDPVLPGPLDAIPRIC